MLFCSLDLEWSDILTKLNAKIEVEKVLLSDICDLIPFCLVDGLNEWDELKYFFVYLWINDNE